MHSLLCFWETFASAGIRATDIEGE